MFRKRKKAEEPTMSREDMEFEAKYKAKLAVKDLEKQITNLNGITDRLYALACDAKKKGLMTSYRMLVTQIKVCESKKCQAETFIFQVKAIQEMNGLTNVASGILNSFNDVMNSLGKITLDKGAMIESQKTFNKNSQNLDKTAAMFENYLNTLGSMDTDEGDANISVDEIEKRISKMADGGATVGEVGNTTEDSLNKELEAIKKKLETC